MLFIFIVVTPFTDIPTNFQYLFIAVSGIIIFRWCSLDFIKILFCRTELKKSGEKSPRVELVEIGPSYDLIVRRVKLASDDLFTTACIYKKARTEEEKVIQCGDVWMWEDSVTVYGQWCCKGGLVPYFYL